jgi:spermidine synthase
MLVALVGLSAAIGLPRLLPWLLLPAALVFFAALWAGGVFKETTGMIYETDSPYNYIQVLEFDDTRFLRLNEGQGVHSVYNPNQLDFSGPWEQFLAAPFFNAPPFAAEDIQSIAIIGLAAGTSARQATAVLGEIPIDGFELDPEIIQIGREYFGMTMPNLNAIAQDGRWGLERSEKTYSLIEIDAYRPPYIPPHLTTIEFFQLCKEHLTEDGTLAINVGRAPEDRRLIDALVATLKRVFQSVHVMDVPNTFNSLVYATVQETSFDNLLANYGHLLGREGIHPLLLNSIQRTLAYQQVTPMSGMVLTDERAPVEWIVNSMVLNFVLYGELEQLQ